MHVIWLDLTLGTTYLARAEHWVPAMKDGKTQDAAYVRQ